MAATSPAPKSQLGLVPKRSSFPSLRLQRRCTAATAASASRMVLCGRPGPRIVALVTPLVPSPTTCRSKSQSRPARLPSTSPRELLAVFSVMTLGGVECATDGRQQPIEGSSLPVAPARAVAGLGEPVGVIGPRLWGPVDPSGTPSLSARVTALPSGAPSGTSLATVLRMDSRSG